MAEILREPLKLPTDVHFGIRLFIRHIVSPWRHMGGFSDYTNTNDSKLNSTDAEHYKTSYVENTFLSLTEECRKILEGFLV